MSERYLNPEQKINTVEVIVHEHPEVVGLQVYEYFRNSANEQKQDFISGKILDLDLSYPDLTLEKIKEIKTPMLQSLVTLMSGEKNLKNEALYNAIEYRYGELFLMDMSRVMNSDSVTNEEHEEAQQLFVQANEALYGKPIIEIFNALASKTIVERTFIDLSDSDEVRGLKHELHSLIGHVDKTDFESFRPSDQLVARIGELVHERFDELVSHIAPEEEYGVTEMTEAIKISLEKMGGKELGWKVEIIPNSSALAVSAHQKIVEVGENRPKIKGDVLEGKILHELGVHTGRSIRAEKAGWLSAAYGQEGYLDFEEALATALEDSYHGKFDDHGKNYQLIAGLTYGYDNHSPRNFRETFEVMWRVNAIGKIKEGIITEKEMTNAKSNAYTSCMRLFRGTTGLQKGVVYLKDLAYFNGQESVWNVLKGVKTQEDFDLLFVGKLNNSKPDHQVIARNIVATELFE